MTLLRDPVMPSGDARALGHVELRPIAPDSRRQAHPPAHGVAHHVRRALNAPNLVRAGCHAAAERLLRDVRGALVRREAWAEAIEVGLSLGRLLLERGRAEDAARVFADAAAQAAATTPRAVIDAGLWQAATATDLGRPAGAESLCRALLARGDLADDDRRRTLAALARALLWQGRAAEAAGLDLTGSSDPYVQSLSVRVLLEQGDVFLAGRQARAMLAATDGGSPIDRVVALSTHLRAMTAVGDRVLVERAFAELSQAARVARTPLRVARARLMMVDFLCRAGQTREAAEQVRSLQRLRSAVPPLLRAAIDERAVGGSRAPGTRGRRTPLGEAADDGMAESKPGSDDPGSTPAIPGLVGVSRAIGDLRAAVARAAATPFAVLIEGESGVGKELVARAIHELSPRRGRRLCDVNCAALPDELLETELFGHSKGAFTGAAGDRPGLFEAASGGTLFLDEVADLSPRAQAKLLRVVQEQEVRRIGETTTRKIDVRLVAAANRDLRAEAAAGRFRHDLLYRIDVVRIRIPPLRERPDDIAVLAAHLWRGAASRVGSTAVLSPDALAVLARYAWPGNVRELQNVVSALAVSAPARGLVPAALLPAGLGGGPAPRPRRLADARAEFERHFVGVVLARAGGSRTRAARELGLSRQGLLKLLARAGLG